MKLGSEFLKEFDGYERPIAFGKTKRQLVFGIGIILGIGFSIGLYFLHFPIVVSMILLAIIVSPFMLYGMKKDVEIKEKLKFRLTIQERVYMTHYKQDEEITKNDFKPNTIQEFDEG